MLNAEFDRILAMISELIDIPDYLHEEAVDKYEFVAEWLGADESTLSQYSPMAYSQGSFRLGTVIKPITDRDCYDIDFVCRLMMEKTEITKRELKQLLGKRLRENEELKPLMEEKGRCWTLNFSNVFSIDILPTIPDAEKNPHGVLLTDKDLHQWQKSNPIEYAEWFKSRMAQEWDAKRFSLAKSRKIEVEEVQDWQIKTTLQKAVQILKRHRDSYFYGKPDPKPASIIITTLAAKAYNGETSLRDALITLIKNMLKHVKQEGGRYCIWNPVADENFAEKWNADRKRFEAFQNWMISLNGAMLNALENNDVLALRGLLGGTSLQKALSGNALTAPANANPLLFVPALADASHVQRPSWQFVNLYQAKVHCEVYSQLRRKKLYTLEEGRSVAKRKKLRLTVTTNVPEPYEVKWQVVNTGDEASGNQRDLRGGFYDSEFKNGRWEDTRYKGTHWVEAFIIKNNACVARSGQYFIKIRNSII